MEALLACYTPEEFDAARTARDLVRSTTAASVATVVAVMTGPDPARVARIHQGLSMGHFPDPYKAILKVWFDAKGFVSIVDLTKQLNLSAGQGRAMISKFSGRMNKIITDPERKEFRTPLNLLVMANYDEHGSSSHKLTDSGREAVKLYLGL